MRILIATASRHGATRELGEWVGSSLEAQLTEKFPITTDSVTVEVRDAEDVHSTAEYDAVVIGSGVYMGRWLPAARALVKREQSELETRPVWLFSSGPIGDGAPSEETPKRDKASWAIEHRVFGGKLDRSSLSRFERFVVRMIHADDGDSRSRKAVDEWAGTICAALTATIAPPITPVGK